MSNLFDALSNVSGLQVALDPITAFVVVGLVVLLVAVLLLLLPKTVSGIREAVSK